ncbi:tRNA preQ1(34) S-adenosylmethionine ribosyltransferase-isomerase QueA [Treponema primitia]|uniref:tRNA preQ1(34) S-adenosylmethionine ribosyltransferase-isomerase QueA n=1 Tax=Treponema primitia TaxID=88058 RepID=UPI0002554E8B|nr:tRNA preQ1(34) S-adenosylmethionine ribosyltransferase-isomerase QueA [Treponema primitia]
MKLTDFSFDLPQNLIAQYPPEQRGQSRLMVLDRVQHSRSHHRMADLPSLLEPGDLLVFNNSKVRKARIYGTGSGGSLGRVEFLLLTRRDPHTWTVMAQRTKRRRIGTRYVFADGLEAEITGEEGELRLLRFDRPIDEAWLDRYGHIPLPPYIRREDTPADSERYQTVYAAVPGSAAAPTAGLHFTEEILARLTEGGIESAFVTLHVGLGTFLPVRSENIEDHRMHEENYSIDEDTAAKIERAKAEKRRVIAVGTTSARTLESAWDGSDQFGELRCKLRRGEGATSIFIYPGYTFKLVDALFTNFHTPESTLLMLVSAFADAKPGAFAGREFILDSYREAVELGYRFFSYGDAMLIV